MKLSLLAVASALVGLTCAQGEGIPSCATPCVNQFTSDGGAEIAGCSRLNVACICSNKDFLSGIACCLVANCSVEDQKKATVYALAFCAANQVTDLPTTVACATTAASTPTGSATSTGTAAATITSPANAASTTAAGTSSRTSSTPTGAAPTNAAGLGVGILGGLAAVAALL